jgi:hypothetical protein
MNAKKTIVAFSAAIAAALAGAGMRSDARAAQPIVALPAANFFDVPGKAFFVDIDDNGVGDVRINGTAGNDRVRFLRSTNGSWLAEIDIGNDGTIEAFLSGNVGDLDLVEILLGGGDDIVDVTLLESDQRINTFHIDMGTGNDNATILYDDEGLTGESTVFDITGGVGNDSLLLTIPDVDGGQLLLRCDMGLGNDSVEVRNQGGHRGFVFDVRCDLGAGDDTFEQVQNAVNLGGELCRYSTFVDAGPQNDTVKLTFTGAFDSDASFRFATNLGDGDDAFLVGANVPSFNVGVGGSEQVRCEIVALGGLGNDSLRFVSDVDGVPTFGIAILDCALLLRFDGGLGDDLLEFDFGESIFDSDSPVSPIAQFRATFDGGAGNDVLRFHASTATNYGGFLSADLRGGAGDDEFDVFVHRFFSLVDPIQDRILVDGGPGADASTIIANITVTQRL